jgi:hypothetical protein
MCALYHRGQMEHHLRGQGGLAAVHTALEELRPVVRPATGETAHLATR